MQFGVHLKILRYRNLLPLKLLVGGCYYEMSRKTFFGRFVATGHMHIRICVFEETISSES